MRFHDDPSLVRACLNGDQFAWSDLVERYRRLVWSVIRKTNLSPDDGEDAFQQVFLALLQSLPQLRESDRLAAWLMTTTRRVCWRISAKTSGSAHAALTEEVAGDATSGANPDSDVQLEGDRQLVRDALERLGGRCRELLEALYACSGEPSYAAIGERLGMRIGSIGPTRQRCLEKLTPILQGSGF